MTEIRLTEMEVSNFKGIKRFVLTAGGQNVTVDGDNATGKTTLIDAYLWLLRGKDSRDNAAFEIKALDAAGSAPNDGGTEHRVEAQFTVDGVGLTLRRAYREKWTKQRGSATEEFSHHTTEYHVDGVPVQKQQYDATVAEHFGTDVALLTDPFHFSQRLPWKDRRVLLGEVCGTVSDGQVIEAHAELAELPSILAGRTVEDAMVVLAAAQRSMNKEIDRMPVRIEEAEEAMVDAPDEAAAAQAAEEVVVGEAEVARLGEEVATIEAGGAVATASAALAECKQAVTSARTDAARDHQAQRSLLACARDEAGDAAYQARTAYTKAEAAVTGDEATLATLTALEDKLNAAEEAEMGSPDWDDALAWCAACDRQLEPAKVEAARAAFNAAKADRLRKLQERRDENAAARTVLEQARDGHAEKLQEAEHARDVAAKAQATAADAVVAHGPDPEPIIDDLLAAQEAAAAKHRTLREDATTAAIDARAARDRVQMVLAEARRVVAASQAARSQGERVEKLRGDQRRLSAQYEEGARQLYLCETFVRHKASTLEERVNDHFAVARFKLFKEHQSGGLTEVCETLCDGVPYNTNLNHGAQVNVGIDIVTTLQAHYGRRLPVWVDQCESITSLLPTEAQVVRLVVSAADQALRAEEG